MANDKDSDLIEVAISQAVKNMKESKEGDILVEWVVCTYVSNPDKEEGSAYPILFSNGILPTHNAKGLLTHHLDLLKIRDLQHLNDEDEDES